MCNALEIRSKAVSASGNVLFLRSSLDWDIQSATLCGIGKRMSMRYNEQADNSNLTSTGKF